MVDIKDNVNLLGKAFPHHVAWRCFAFFDHTEKCQPEILRVHSHLLGPTIDLQCALCLQLFEAYVFGPLLFEAFLPLKDEFQCKTELTYWS